MVETSEQLDLLLPGHRHQVHVAQRPRVVFLADPRGPLLRGRLAVEPVGELSRRNDRLADRALELRVRVGNAPCEVLEVIYLLARGAGTGNPQIPRVAGEIDARLGEQRRYAAELRGEPGL